MIYSKQKLQAAVSKYLIYTPTNICYRDFIYLADICKKYGADNVHKEIERQEKEQEK